MINVLTNQITSHISVSCRTTNSDGRCPGLITREAFSPGTYKMRFETGLYWEGLGETCFYPYVEVSDKKSHRHAFYD